MLHHYSQCIASLQGAKPLTPSAWLLLGKAWVTLQQYEHAADSLAQVHGDKYATAEASYWLERAYQALGAESYKQLENSFPDSWRSHQLRAEGFALRGDRDDAMKEYQAALQLVPNQAELHEAVGEFPMKMRSVSWRRPQRLRRRAPKLCIFLDGSIFLTTKMRRPCPFWSARSSFNPMGRLRSVRAVGEIHEL